MELQYYQPALVSAVLANIHRDPKKSKVYEPRDFMPGQKKPEKQTADEMLAHLQQWQLFLTEKFKKNKN